MKTTERAVDVFAFRSWRSWVLAILLVGPVLAYLVFGTIWLYERGWLLVAGTLWVLCGIGFGVLGSRWTRSQHPVLPPIDWDAPQTFAKFDRDAWAMVEKEAEQGDLVPLEKLTEFDLYIETGRRLAKSLADHYHPLTTDPLQTVPVVDVLTALELAAEDLNHLCRQVPGGDMVTPSHWKKAVQMAGYLQRANDIYSYLLPIFSPVGGLVRLGTQQWMVKPAWRDMQQNLLRWFFRAYVNRLGMHLIELYSGRLAIGADRYRRLTRRGLGVKRHLDLEPATIRIAFAGARGSGKSRLLSLINQTRAGDLTLLKARLSASGIDGSAIDRLKGAELLEVAGYTTSPAGESARDRSTRAEAVENAVEADVLILVVDARRDSANADAAFLKAWDQWFLDHPGFELPAAFAVLTGIDHHDYGGAWTPPYAWDNGQGIRETVVRTRMNALRSLLPPSVTAIVPIGLVEPANFGLIESVLPVLLTQLQRAERGALIRHFQQFSQQSKVRRLASQMGRHGKSIWDNFRSPRSRASSHTTPR